MKKLEVKDLKENLFEAIGKEWMLGYGRHQREIQYNDCRLGWTWRALE